MNVNIFGVGKSGTSILYVLLQHMLKEQLRGTLKSYYEPLLRDQLEMGSDYLASKPRMQSVDSLSNDGISTHLKLPMLIGEPRRFKDNEYLKGIYRERSDSIFTGVRRLFNASEQQKPHRLVKYIRASGRYLLIDSISRPAKSVFILRNPYSTANSIKNRFSFYGEEFHRSDRNRFVKEVNERYGLEHDPDSFENEIDAQLFYWFYSNKFALESFNYAKSRPLVVQYEAFSRSPDSHILRLCEFLGLDFKSAYIELAAKPVGPLTEQQKLDVSELKTVEKYMENFGRLLAEHGLSRIDEEIDLPTANELQANEPWVLSKTAGLHARAVDRVLRAELAAPVAAPSAQTANPMFAHIINPVIAGEKSDLRCAQPITFSTMRHAAEFARMHGVGVEQLATFFAEDEAIVPDNFKKCAFLERSCLDFAKFGQARKLPLFQDIFDRVLSNSVADYIIYTNVDIALMPHFYVTAKKLVSQGADAVTICRRTLSAKYTSESDIPEMYADLGDDHPGTDCFILKRELAERLNLERIAIGAQYCAFALRANLHILGEKINEYKRVHMTFHIGDDRVWAEQDQYTAYNVVEIDRMFEVFAGSGGQICQQQLQRFTQEFEGRKSNWRTTRNITQPHQ